MTLVSMTSVDVKKFMNNYEKVSEILFRDILKEIEYFQSKPHKLSGSGADTLIALIADYGHSCRCEMVYVMRQDTELCSTIASYNLRKLYEASKQDVGVIDE